MSVEAANALGGVRSAEIGVHPGREFSPLSFAGRKMANRGERFAVVIAGRKGFQDFAYAGNGGRKLGPSEREGFPQENLSQRPYFFFLLFAKTNKGRFPVQHGKQRIYEK